MEPAGNDILRCTGCAREFAVVDGIPALFRTPVPVESLGLAGELELIESAAAQLSSYLGTWESGAEALLEKLGALPRVALSLELGCGVGRGLLELSRTATAVVGLDHNGAMLQAARRLLAGEELRYRRRMAGRSYAAAVVRGQRVDNVQLVCADALDPPFAPGTFDRVVALNVLDNVPSPRALLHHLHLLAAPGGEIVLSSPYAWRDDITEEAERLAGPDPAAALRDEIRELGWSVEDDRELRWRLRHDARSSTVYRVHYVRARR